MDEFTSFSPLGCDGKFTGSGSVAVVPKGWNRIIEKGVIIYISPNKSRIRSYDDIIEYIESDSTCKCGLECPVRPKELFNFDPNVASRLGMTDFEATSPEERSCNACKEFDILLSTSLAAKRDGKRRRRGRIKCVVEEEDKIPDRKKICLTGASPLEMFQSGMQAINSLSGLNSKRQGGHISATEKDSLYVDKSITPPPSINAKHIPLSSNASSIGKSNLSSSLPGGSANSSLVVSKSDPRSGTSTTTANTNVSSNKVLLANAIAFEEQVAHVQTSFQPVATQSHPVNSITTNALKSLSQTHLISERDSSSPQSRSSLDTIGGSMVNTESLSSRSLPVACSTKRTSKTSNTQQKRNTKVIPHGEVKNARELQLSDYLHHHALKKGIMSEVKTSSVVSATCVPHSGAVSSTSNYKAVHVSGNSSQSSLLLSNSTTSPPPNITVSTSNQLPQALVNQLALKYTSSSNQKLHNPPLSSALLQPTVSTHASSTGTVHTEASALSKTVNCSLRPLSTPSSNIHHNPSLSMFSVSQMNTNEQLSHSFNQDVHRKSSSQQSHANSIRMKEMAVVSANNLPMNSSPSVSGDLVRHTTPAQHNISSSAKTNSAQAQGNGSLSNMSVCMAPAGQAITNAHDLGKNVSEFVIHSSPGAVSSSHTSIKDNTVASTGDSVNPNASPLPT